MALASPESRALSQDSADSRISFSRIPSSHPMPNLIQIQRDSFGWFKTEGLKDLFTEISPISDFTGRNMDLHLAVTGPNDEPGYWFDDPKFNEEQCRDRDST